MPPGVFLPTIKPQPLAAPLDRKPATEANAGLSAWPTALSGNSNQDKSLAPFAKPAAAGPASAAESKSRAGAFGQQSAASRSAVRSSATNKTGSQDAVDAKAGEPATGLPVVVTHSQGKSAQLSIALGSALLPLLLMLLLALAGMRALRRAQQKHF